MAGLEGQVQNDYPMKKYIALLTIIALTTITVFSLTPAPIGAQSDGEPGQDFVEPDAGVYKAKVLDVMKDVVVNTSQGFDHYEDLVMVRILNGPFEGELRTFSHVRTGQPVYDINAEKGDVVLLLVESVDGVILETYITDYLRETYLVKLAIGFVLLLVLLGGIKGVKSLVSLTVTGLAVGFVLLPLLLKGHSPILITVLIAAAVASITFIVIGGLTRKTAAAIIGTTAGVLVAGVLALAVGKSAHLTGFGQEEAAMLMYIPQGIRFDYQGLLFSGIIIGALGAVMDVGMSIASAMEEVRRVNPAIDQKELIRAGLNVGRDIMGTMANTLILAYTGAAIPLMLLFMAYDTPMVKILNLDVIATEVVRAIAGSIGLIIAIPITAVVGGLILKKGRAD